MRCVAARRLVSQRLDGVDPGAVLDVHLADCGGCRRFEGTTAEVRRALRFAPVGTVPDIAGAVRARLDETEPVPLAPRRRARPNRRAAVAALVAGVVIGALLVSSGGDGPEPVAAAELPVLVARAQGAVTGLHAELRMVERGWNPQVPTREFTGVLDYRAPESLALTWQDRTSYPSAAWRPDDVSLVTNGRSWVATGLYDCPSEAQPACSASPRERGVTGRPPFAEDALVPLDLIVPVQSFSTTGSARVVGEGTVAGRPTIEVEATADQVQPLLDGLRPAGNLRQVHSTDRVSLSLDADALVPLRVEVRASDDPGRPAWALSRGYADRPGVVVLAMEVRRLDLGPVASSRFVPPAVDGATDAGYRRGAPGIGLHPAVPEGFSRYDAGRIRGATPTGVWSWSDGRAWIRLQATRAWRGPGLFGDLGALVGAEQTPVGEVWVGADGHRVGLHGDAIDLVVDGSVPTDRLIEVVEGLGLRSTPLPAGWPERRTATPRDVAGALPGVLVLAAPGFGPVESRVEGQVVVQFAADGDGRRLLLVEGVGAVLTPTLDPDPEPVGVRGVQGRWLPTYDELQWADQGRVHSLRGSGLSRDELVAVAEGLGSR